MYIIKALNWLAFVPAKKGGPLPLRDIDGVDSVDRCIEFTPPKGLTYDPRLLFNGLVTGTKENASWQSGVIVTENRTAEATKPADPADLSSQERVSQQAGGVWFPDSAYKTAQALRDFNREGLPCIIFANWRGFSGGQRDMFDEVLKFGSMIVDALVAYQQPIFVYIPPFAELRGGAWVVVDSTINADVMEFYAAEDSRGGVLEPAGAASIKFRDKDIIATAHRIDHRLIALDQEHSLVKNDEGASSIIIKQIKEREKALFGVYQQVAVHFADLHDTPGRMKALGVIRKEVKWSESRTFFYWRLRRKLLEFEIANSLKDTAPPVVATTSAYAGWRKSVIAEMGEWFVETTEEIHVWEDDRSFVEWMDDSDNKASLNEYIIEKKAMALGLQLGGKLSELMTVSEGDVGGEAVRRSLSQLSEQDRAQLLRLLKE